MDNHSRLLLAAAAALAWTAIATAPAAADSTTQTVRSRQVATVSAKPRAVQVASTAAVSCQTIACPRYRLVGIAY